MNENELLRKEIELLRKELELLRMQLAQRAAPSYPIYIPAPIIPATPWPPWTITCDNGARVTG